MTTPEKLPGIHRLVKQLEAAGVVQYGTTVPTDGTAGYKAGMFFLDTDASDGAFLYVNEGTATSCDFNAIPSVGADLTFAGTNTFSGANTFANLITSAPTQTTSGIGAVAASATTAVTEYGDGVFHKTLLTCTAFDLGTAGDEAGVGQYMGAKLYDFPEGQIVTLGAVIDGSITLAAPAIDAWDGDIALGTAAPTEHAAGLVAASTGRFLQSTATTQAAAKVANVDAIMVATGLTESGARWTDGTATALDLFMNLLIDDNVAHDNSITGTFTGTVQILWTNLGDK